MVIGIMETQETNQVNLSQVVSDVVIPIESDVAKLVAEFF